MGEERIHIVAEVVRIKMSDIRLSEAARSLPGLTADEKKGVECLALHSLNARQHRRGTTALPAIRDKMDLHRKREGQPEANAMLS